MTKKGCFLVIFAKSPFLTLRPCHDPTQYTGLGYRYIMTYNHQYTVVPKIRVQKRVKNGQKRVKNDPKMTLFWPFFDTTFWRVLRTFRDRISKILTQNIKKGSFFWNRKKSVFGPKTYIEFLCTFFDQKKVVFGPLFDTKNGHFWPFFMDRMSLFGPTFWPKIAVFAYENGPKMGPKMTHFGVFWDP